MINVLLGIVKKIEIINSEEVLIITNKLKLFYQKISEKKLTKFISDIIWDWSDVDIMAINSDKSKIVFKISEYYFAVYCLQKNKIMKKLRVKSKIRHISLINDDQFLITSWFHLYEVNILHVGVNELQIPISPERIVNLNIIKI